MALSVCLLPDERAERALRSLWRRLEEHGLTSLLSHTHGRHRPHLTLVSLLECDPAAVLGALGPLPAALPLRVRLEGLGVFRRSRCWLAPSASEPLAALQRRTVAALAPTGAVLHRSYEPGVWTPHLTLAPRLHLADLPVVARLAFEVLPLDVTLERLALVDTSTGRTLPVARPVS